MTFRDDGENTDLFEPLIVSGTNKSRPRLNDLVLTLAEKSVALASSLPPAIAGSVADLISVVNCHHNNLIEGQSIRPVDIERALSEDYSDDAKTRVLQLKSQAHISVQKWIDDKDIGDPLSPAVICEIHRRLSELLPRAVVPMEPGDSNRRVDLEPGVIRTRDIEVEGRKAISPGAVPRFLFRLEQAHKSAGRIDRILIAACGHHRLLWVNPFLHGNGRVARLVSYAALRSAITTKGLWSVARGLAQQEKEYRAYLQACDEPRRGNSDGRGTLSEGALANFAEFYLETCIDQVDFMSSLMQPHRLQDRVLRWSREEIRAGTLPSGSDAVLRAILYRGELKSGEVVSIMGDGDKSAQQLTQALIRTRIIRFERDEASVRVAFPASVAMKVLPGVFLED